MFIIKYCNKNTAVLHQMTYGYWLCQHRNCWCALGAASIHIQGKGTSIKVPGARDFLFLSMSWSNLVLEHFIFQLDLQYLNEESYSTHYFLELLVIFSMGQRDVRQIQWRLEHRICVSVSIDVLNFEFLAFQGKDPNCQVCLELRCFPAPVLFQISQLSSSSKLLSLRLQFPTLCAAMGLPQVYKLFTFRAAWLWRT